MKLWAVLCVAGTNVTVVSLETTQELAQAAITQLFPVGAKHEPGAQYGQWEGADLAIYRVDAVTLPGWLYNETKLENTRIHTYTCRVISTPNALDVGETTADAQIETGRRVIDPLHASALIAAAHQMRAARVLQSIARGAIARVCAMIAAPEAGGPAPHLRVSVSKCVADVFGGAPTRARVELARALSKECTREVGRREKSTRALGKSCALQCAAVAEARARAAAKVAEIRHELVDLYADYEELLDVAASREQYLEREVECGLQRLNDANDAIDRLVGADGLCGDSSPNYPSYNDYSLSQSDECWRAFMHTSTSLTNPITRPTWATVAQVSVSTPLLHTTSHTF